LDDLDLKDKFHREQERVVNARIESYRLEFEKREEDKAASKKDQSADSITKQEKAMMNRMAAQLKNGEIGHLSDR